MLHLNPKARSIDRMYAWPITPHCETSHKGMLLVFIEIMKSYQMCMPVDEGRRFKLLPNADKREINMYGDALSSRNWYAMEYELYRRVAEIGMEKWVRPMIETFKCVVMQHDYLHEIRMHRQDCIWRSMYGGFLQCLQVEVGQKRLNGDCVKKSMQGHESFLIDLVYTALRRYRFERFLQRKSNDQLKKKIGDTSLQWLLRMHEEYQSYCQDVLSNKDDEPSYVCALLLKYMESYSRGVKAVRKANFWLLEKEGVAWLGAYKLSGKKNYVTETLHRMEEIYGEKMNDIRRESIRMNRFFVLSEGGDAVTFDELNELLNLWNKQSGRTLNFSTACDQPRFVILMRKCAYEAFGKRKETSAVKPSQQAAIAKLIAFFERARIFDPSNGKRTLEKDFFWNLVRRPTKIGSKRIENREKVPLSKTMNEVYNRLFHFGDKSDDYANFDEDLDDAASAASSCMGDDTRERGVAEVEDKDAPDDPDGLDGDEDWGDIKGKERTAKITESLKKMGNVRQKPMSPLILKDLLGIDAEIALKDIQKSRANKHRREKRKFDIIDQSVDHFDYKMEKRRSNVRDSLNQSSSSEVIREQEWWEREFDKIMVEERSKN